MDAVQGPQPWGKVRTGSTGRPPSPVPIFLSPSHTLHEGPLWTTRDLLHRKNLRSERSRGKATATTDRRSPARPEMLNHCRNPPSGRGSRALWPWAALRMTEEAARRLPVSEPPPNPASAWSNAPWFRRGSGRRPPAKLRVAEHGRNYHSGFYRKGCGVLTAAAQGRAVYSRNIDRLPTLPRPQSASALGGGRGLRRSRT